MCIMLFGWKKGISESRSRNQNQAESVDCACQSPLHLVLCLEVSVELWLTKRGAVLLATPVWVFRESQKGLTHVGWLIDTGRTLVVRGLGARSKYFFVGVL
jgi:hypothetical protein